MPVEPRIGVRPELILLALVIGELYALLVLVAFAEVV